MTEEIKGQVRHVLSSIGGIGVGMGVIQASWVEPIVGLGMIVASAVWSWMAKR
jgi:hypothetical protein